MGMRTRTCTTATATYYDEQKIILWPRKLKDLVYEKLDQRRIQRYGEPHSSYEDAVAAMDLYKKVRTKWEKVMEYKISKTEQILLLQRQQQQQEEAEEVEEKQN